MDELLWDDLRVLLAALREGSFTRAAARLGVEQSTVSRRIAALEARLGRPLFHRDRAGPSPTALGERLRAHAERVEREVHALVDTSERHERAVEGRVRLATTEAMAVQVIVPRVLPALRKKHPKLYVDLVTSDEQADLGAREADIALRFFRPTRGELRAQRIANVSVAPIASRAYRTQGRSLRELDWIVYELGPGRSPEADWVQRHTKRDPVMRCNGYLACVEAVRAGLGVSLLASAVCSWDPTLRVLPLGDEGEALPALELWVVAPSSLRGVPRVDAVWDTLATDAPKWLERTRRTKPTRRASTAK
ncbi:MAG: LysR family transcriptional regulator [Myxococcales bacterium]|nr:LysR family transcriptional regulator [Myxococcales bacterium]